MLLSTTPVRKFFQSHDNRQLGDPDELARIVVNATQGRGVAKGKEFLALGSDSVEILKDTFKKD